MPLPNDPDTPPLTSQANAPNPTAIGSTAVGQDALVALVNSFFGGRKEKRKRSRKQYALSRLFLSP
ncbi:hypothetical protein OE88DRAFT_1659737, partial [Heliocybe sulcata]